MYTVAGLARARRMEENLQKRYRASREAIARTVKKSACTFNNAERDMMEEGADL